MDGANHIYAYYQQIKQGQVTVGRWVRLIYEYIVHGLESKAFFYDAKKADKAIEWIETHCFHTEGALAPSPFLLEPWQKAFIAAVFGIVDEHGLRQWREVLLVIGRKNGKSLLASSIANYMWRVDGGYGARVFCIAPKLDQADLVYANIWQMTTLDPEYQAMVEAAAEKDMHNKRINDMSDMPKRRQTDYFIPGTNSSVKKIAFSAKKSDGFNPSLCVCDEIAAWEGDKGLKQYEVMKSGMGARPEGLLLSLTTSGYVNDSIYDEMIKRATRFLMGDSKERRLLPVLYMVDDAAKWDDINELRKANPNLGVSVSVDYMLEEIAVAEQSLSKRAEFLCKYANVKQNASVAWFNTPDVEKNFSPHSPTLDDFSRCYCVCGLDLSQTTDLTAAVCVIEKQKRLHVFAHFWMPAQKIEEATARDGVPYMAYVKRGMLSPSGDNFVDYRDCYQWFVDLVEKYRLYPLKVGYDRYSASYLIQDMTAYGFQVDDVYQGENLTPVINEVDGLMRDGVFDFGDNDLLKIHLLNSALKLNNETSRKRLIKISQTQRIDGMAALLDAMTVRQKWYAEIGGQLANDKR